MSKKNFTALWRSNPWVAPYCLCKVTTKLAGSVRVYVNSLAVPQVMNFMSMHSMLVKARPIKGPILRSVLIFMGILSPSILIVHEFDLVSKSAFYQLGSWTILKQMSWYLLIQVILFEIDCAFFYTNLHELFCQFISWTNWVNSGKFMVCKNGQTLFKRPEKIRGFQFMSQNSGALSWKQLYFES